MKNSKINDFYHGNDQPQNLDELIDWFSDAAKRQIHGLRDNDEFNNGILIKSKKNIRLDNLRRGYGELVCHCRYISKTMINLLENVGLDARLVEWISNGNDPLDLRHTCFEVYFDDQYILSDVDMSVLFLNEGSYFSALDLKKSFDNNEINKSNIQRLSKKKVAQDFPILGFQKIMNNNKLLLDWYKPKTNALMFNLDIYTEDTSLENIQIISSNLVDSNKEKEKFLSLESFEHHYYNN